jgi:hypothetical protein
MLDLHLKNIGTITMDAKKIEINGFDADDAMCREVAALALIWAIGRMQNELSALIRKPGGTGNTSVD